jgi:RNA polymerase sigma-70 factor (ECF subfamily)
METNAVLSMPSLLRRVADRDANAFPACVDAYGPLVWSLARRAEPQSADDAVQEIFLDLWKSAERYDPSVASEATFIATIARRRLIDRRRRSTRQPQAVDLADHVERLTEPDRVGRAVQLRDEADAAKEALAELRDEQRQVLESLLLEGRTYSETAEVLELPLGTVKTHARRGLERVRELLDRRTTLTAERRKP